MRSVAVLAALMGSAMAQSFRDNPDIDVCDAQHPITTLSSGTIHDGALLRLFLTYLLA